MKITGKELANDIKESIDNVSSETLREVSDLLGLYNILNFDHIQDIFTIEEE